MTECFASVSLHLELVESVRKEKEMENDQGRKIRELKPEGKFHYYALIELHLAIFSSFLYQINQGRIFFF